MALWIPTTIALVSLLLVGCANAFYPAYKFDKIEKKAMDTILMQAPQFARQAPTARGSFISPLFGYRFMSQEPSNNAAAQIEPPTSEEEEGLGPEQEEVAASNYDPLFFGPPQKKNFYTHIWRDIVQRMPAYRSHRHFQTPQRDEPLLEKRNPADRMHAIRMG